ncbi:hypothetical protein L9F63_002948 [Diploptera punctata]|uniref:CHK kinase-like domain-containing protein n=1 Tax=Diploptera punctata TaxID=6984 RepID=A0AAD7ZSV7_DIPPU|nr:hypothetical protein L9F63_002948 [Diploptera punctata]
MEAPWLDKNRMEVWLNSPVKEILSEDNSKKGDNYLSNMKRLKVKTADGQVYSLVVKCRLEEGFAAEVFRETTIFKREQDMYGHILNKMAQLLQNAFPDGVDPFAAKCYYACKSFLVLEDMNASGFKMEDRRLGLDLDQCLLVLRTIAKFHAASVILHEQNPSIFEKYGTSLFCDDSILEYMRNVWTGFTMTLANEVATWGEECHTYSVKLRESSGRQNNEFNVLNHGDLWTNNMLIKNRTEGIRFVDYQLIHHASPAIDLHYFITTSAKLEVVRNHRDYLIKEYHNKLCETLTALGYDKKIITLEELYEDLDKKAMYGLFTMLGPYAVIQSDPNCGYSFDEALSTGKNPGFCYVQRRLQGSCQNIASFIKQKRHVGHVRLNI